MNQFIHLWKKAYFHFRDRRASRMGAAVAYYAVFSSIPLLVLLISITSLVFDRSDVVYTIRNQLTYIIGGSASTHLIALLDMVRIPRIGTPSALISLGVVLFAALAALGEIHRGLNELWQEKILPLPKGLPPKTIVTSFVTTNLRLLFVVLTTAITVILSVTAHILLRAIPGEVVIQNAITLLLVVGLCMTTYRLLLPVRLSLSDLCLGALTTSLLLLIGKILLGIYLPYSSSITVFSGAGSLVGVLAWIYYSTQVFYLSASFLFMYSKK